MSTRTRTREDAAVRKGQIIEQALRIVGELGYYGFTIQALAERCGISNAGLLYYFGSKDKLLLALLDEIERRIEERIEPLVATATKGSQTDKQAFATMAELLRAIMQQFCEDVTVTRFVAALQYESMNEAHPAHDWFRDREDKTIRLFTQLTASWVSEPLSTARQLHALMHGIGQQWLRSNEAFDLIEEWDRAFDALLPPPRP